MTATRPAPTRKPAVAPPSTGPITLAKIGGRISFFMMTYLLVMGIFIAQLINLQVIKAPKLASIAAGKRIDTSVIPAIRGSITDVNGVPIATTVIARNISIDQTLVKDPKSTAKDLAPILKLSVKTVQDRLTGTKRFNYVAKQITPEQWKQVAMLQIPGMYSEQTTKRVYPAGKLGASLVGFVGIDGQGLGGLEYALDGKLAGVNGSVTVERVHGREIPTSERDSVDAVNGTNVRLTIDRDIQALAERTLADEIKKTDAESGDVIVMNPHTGDILAMATYPSFDPNNPLKSQEKQRRNDAVADAFEPGSTSKVMTIAAVLEEGAATPESKFTIPPNIKRGGTTFRDHDKHDGLRLTLNGILAKSSNIGAILASEKIGQKKFLSYLKKFGMGEPTGLKFPGETQGLVPRPGDDRWSDTTFPTLAFGQGLSVSAMQTASVYATIANDGVRMTPRLVSGYVNDAGAFTPKARTPGIRVVSATTSKTVREMLESVVSKDGTAPAAQIPGYRVAGKTGTANRVSEKSGLYQGYTASFVGFAPAEQPELVVAVFIHNPIKGHYGNAVAGPVFREVMMYALAQQKIPPSTTKRPKMSVDW